MLNQSQKEKETEHWNLLHRNPDMYLIASGVQNFLI